MTPHWMMQREMRFVTFSRTVPLMSLVGNAAEPDHEELAARWNEQRVWTA